MRVLVIEDDRTISSFIANGLRQEGFVAETAADGVEGLDRARSQSWDVIIVDVMLPRLDGLSLVEALRRANVLTPVLFLSARHTVDDRVKGLQSGGDDYLTKPFAFPELLARVQALMRRGFRAFVGASFAEIFFGNCTALGLPCVALAPADLARLMDSVELDPAQEVEVDLAAKTVRCRAGVFSASIPDGARGQLLEGSWNATSVLLEAGDAIESTARRLPYVSGFAG